MEIAEQSVAQSLRERILRARPDWREALQLTAGGEHPVLTLAPPHCESHTMSIEVLPTGATISYSDGHPPGPAEVLFDWEHETVDDGFDAVAEYLDELVRGEILLVREGLSKLTQFLRRHDCRSLLWFVTREEFDCWSLRRCRRVLQVWTVGDGAEVRNLNK